MLEDSITSSPNKNNRSIHKARLQRKIRRHCGQEIEDNESRANECDANKIADATIIEAIQERVPSLADMYWEDDEHPSSSNVNATFRVQTQKYGADFDPFEDELLLAVADRLYCAQSQAHAQLRKQKLQQLRSGQGFHKCSQLLLESNKDDQVENGPRSPSPNNILKLPIINGPKTQFGITESELLHFCAAVEEKEELQEKESVEETPPPKKSKSIIESILEDFCSSPLSVDGQEQHCSFINNATSSAGQLLCEAEDRTPVFHFKNKPLRTYSCRRSKGGVRTSIAQRFETVASNNADEDDNISNCSSGLSVQEDLTQPSETPLNSVDINKSAKVCENLLNLSAFFTQQSILDASPSSNSTETFQTAQEMSQGEDVAMNTFNQQCARTAQLIDEIVTLRKAHISIFSDAVYSDAAEFRGFPATPKQVDETLLDRNIHRLNTTILNCRIDLDTTTLEDDFAADVFEDEISSSSSLTGRVSTECELNRASFLQESSNRADELFSDSEDEWQDDCDFFKHFKTQDALRRDSASKVPTIQPATPPKKFNGFMSASRKPIVISEAAQQRAARILADVENNFENELEATLKDSTYTTINVEAQAQKSKDLSFENDENLPGFQTASNKQIKISEEAKKRAHALLSDLPDTPEDVKENLDLVDTNKQLKCNAINSDDVELGDIQLSEWLIDEATQKTDALKVVPAFKGFETASKKHIIISEAAKRQALNILSDLPELPKTVTDTKCEIPENFKATTSTKNLKGVDNNSSYSACTGFRTASRKSINISAEAKERAAKILETLTDFPEKISKNYPSAEEDMEGIQLSEWPLNDECYNKTEETPIATTAKRKIEHITDDLEQYSQTPEQTAKTLDKQLTKNDMHRTPLTSQINNAALGSSNSSTPLTKNPCLTSFAKSAIISRKNLLSLSKRKKIKYNQDVKTLEKTLATPSTEHIVNRMSTTPATPNAQEFFTAVPNTSTPRPIRMRNDVPAKSSEIDMDFKHIEWEQSHEISTLNTSKSSLSSKFDTSCENITVVSANPSPKMRIARLHMYGKPPPVSPILMNSTNNCRPSGLRRGRSMQKQ